MIGTFFTWIIFINDCLICIHGVYLLKFTAMNANPFLTFSLLLPEKRVKYKLAFKKFKDWLHINFAFPVRRCSLIYTTELFAGFVPSSLLKEKNVCIHKAN